MVSRSWAHHQRHHLDGLESLESMEKIFSKLNMPHQLNPPKSPLAPGLCWQTQGMLRWLAPLTLPFKALALSQASCSNLAALICPAFFLPSFWIFSCSLACFSAWTSWVDRLDCVTLLASNAVCLFLFEGRVAAGPGIVMRWESGVKKMSLFFPELWSITCLCSKFLPSVPTLAYNATKVLQTRSFSLSFPWLPHEVQKPWRTYSTSRFLQVQSRKSVSLQPTTRIKW